MTHQPHQAVALAKPDGVTPYMWREFTRYFQHGAGFWTSEDGSLMSLVIIRLPDALAVLEREHPSQARRFVQVPLVPRYVHRVWLEADYFDGPYPRSPRRGRGWSCTDQETPFPVYELELA